MWGAQIGMQHRQNNGLISAVVGVTVLALVSIVEVYCQRKEKSAANSVTTRGRKEYHDTHDQIT